MRRSETPPDRLRTQAGYTMRELGLQATGLALVSHLLNDLSR